MTNGGDRKKLVIYSVIAILAIAAAIGAAMMSGKGSEETHRDLNDVPPKGAGKFRDKTGG